VSRLGAIDGQTPCHRRSAFRRGHRLLVYLEHFINWSDACGEENFVSGFRGDVKRSGIVAASSPTREDAQHG